MEVNDKIGLLIKASNYDALQRLLPTINGYTNLKVILIGNSYNTGLTVSDSLLEGFNQLYNVNCETFIYIDSNLFAKPYWLSILIELSEQYPEAVISGLNAPTGYPSIEFLEEHHVKKTICEDNILFKRQIFHLVLQALLNENDSISRILERANVPMLAVFPTVLQYTNFMPSEWSNPYSYIENINNYFRKIFCINLDRRQDRWEQCQIDFKNNKIINVTRFSAIDGKTLDNKSSYMHNGRIGCSLSHAQVLREMIKNKWEKILILEDDALFIDDFYNKFIQSIPFIPDDFDMLYLGGSNRTPPLVKINEIISKTVDTLTTGAYAVSLQFAKNIISKIESLDDPVDVVYINNQRNFNCYIFNKHLIKQRPGWSDIESQHVDYSQYFA
jgi:GR25 family glycosyltransferase involved in LPS biosynthesis